MFVALPASVSLLQFSNVVCTLQVYYKDMVQAPHTIYTKVGGVNCARMGLCKLLFTWWCHPVSAPLVEHIYTFTFVI